MEKTKRVNHFESTEKTTDQAILGLTSGLFETINKIFDTQHVLAELRSITNNNRKIELWEELKNISFAKTTAYVYASSLLVASLRVHLSVIGGYLYKENQQHDEMITKEVQTIFSLVLIQHLMSSGLNKLISTVRENVERIMKNHQLKEKLTLNEVEQIFWSIQHEVDKGINRNLAKFILPSDIYRNQQDEILNKMLADSMDVFECGDFIEVFESSVSNGFTLVIDKIAEFYSKPASNGLYQLNNELKTPLTSKDINYNENLNNEMNRYVNINIISLPLAKVIPILNALSKSPILFSNDNYNKENLVWSLISLQLKNQNPKNLASNVYEVYSN